MVKRFMFVLLMQLSHGARVQTAADVFVASDEFDAADELDSSQVLEVSEDFMQGDESLDAFLNDSAAVLAALEHWGEDQQPRRGIWEKSGGSWYPKGSGHKCPDECLYCCKFGMGQNKERFHCITKYGLSCPKGRKCRVYFRTSNKKEYQHYTPGYGSRQRVALGAYLREVYYTDAEKSNPPTMTKCPSMALLLHLNYAEANRVKIRHKATYTLDLPKPVDDGGWVSVPKKKKDKFQCPHECLECCSSSWNRWFTCIMRSDEMPDRECSTPSMRSKTDGYRTECKFTDSEWKLPGAKRKMGACSDRYKCCCPMDDHWTEEVCLPGDTPDLIFMKSSRGTIEEFRYASHMETYQNRGSPCRKSFGGLRYTRPFPTTGCCLQGHRYCKRRCKHGCCGWGFQCDRFEMLHTCSSDHGITKNGKIYARSMSQLGTCFPNKGDVDSTILRLNNPDSNGNIRMVPLPPITTGMSKGKPRYTMLEGTSRNECPLGTLEIGADFHYCHCKSDKLKCASPGQSKQPSLLETNESSMLGYAENEDFDNADNLESQEYNDEDFVNDPTNSQ